MLPLAMRRDILALLAPPGVPHFFTRERTVAAGPVRLTGRAWGAAPVARVEVSCDGGASWSPAQLAPPERQGRYAWQLFEFDWQVRRDHVWVWHFCRRSIVSQATVGRHVLLSRAICETGEEQPLEARPNPGGYCNNSVQRVPVRCVLSLTDDDGTDATPGAEESAVPSQ